jgi:hypothetical protein
LHINNTLDNFGQELVLPKKIKQKVLLKPVVKEVIENPVVEKVLDDVINKIEPVETEQTIIETPENIEIQEIPEEKLVIPELKSFEQEEITPDIERINTEPIPDISDIAESREEQKLNEQVGIAPVDVDSKEYNDFLFNKEKLDIEPNPCWEGYEQYGTKDLDGREVPNCVPIAEK